MDSRHRTAKPLSYFGLAGGLLSQASVFALLFAILSSCGQKAAPTSGKFEVLAGNNQIVAPREAAQQAVEFVMTDSSGLPVPGVKVEVRLLELEESIENPTAEQIAELWKKTVADEAALNPGALAEKLGRIDGSRFVTTDGQGKISLKIVAPSRFSARIVVAVKTVPGEGAPDMLTWALLSTASSESLGKITLESNYQNNVIPAGKNVDFFIILRDQSGAIVTSYEGASTFAIESTQPAESWAGVPSTGFKPEVSCVFVAGRCAVPGGPFNFANAQTINVVIKGIKPAISRYETKIEVEKGKTPAQVIATDRAGGPSANASPVRNVTLDAGQTANLSSAFIDEGGNYLADAENTSWISSDSSFQQFLPFDTRNGFALKPTKAGIFELKLSSSSARNGFTLPVDVKSGKLSAWKIETQHNGLEVAGSCFRITVTAIDAAGNTVPTVEGQIVGELKIAGTTETPPAVNDIAHFERLGIRLTDEVPAKINFQFGTGQANEQACLYDATNVSPKITFFASGLQSELPVVVLRGQPSALRISELNAGELIDNVTVLENDTNLCLTPRNPENLGNPCIKFNADTMLPSVATSPPATPVTPDELWRVQTPITLYASVTDVAGNFIEKTNARWVVTGPLGELTSTGQSRFALLNSFIPVQNIVTTFAGKGIIQVEAEKTATVDISPQRFAYEIVHGAPHSAVVETVTANKQIATEPFRIKASIFDKWKNAATDFKGTLAATAALTRAPKSPNGATAAIPSFPWNMNFSAGGGVLVSGTNETLKLPCACNPDVQPAAGLGCRDNSPTADPLGYEIVSTEYLKDANNVVLNDLSGNPIVDENKSTYKCPQVELSIPSLGPGTFLSEQLRIDPGGLNRITWRTGANGSGDDIAEKFPDSGSTPLEQEIFKPLNLFVAGYDALGNYRNDVTSDLTWTWLTPNISRLPSFITRTATPSIISQDTGEGFIKADSFFPTGFTVTSPTIRFKSTQAVRYRIETNHTNPETLLTTEVAGEPFNIIIKAIDPLGNVDPNFAGTRKFTFVSVSDPSWASYQPVLPEGFDLSCSFTGGVCILSPSVIGKTNWVIMNSLRPSIINMTETTLPADLAGKSRLEGTFATTIFMTEGPAESVVLADKPGGPKPPAPLEAARVKRFAANEVVRITTDETAEYYGALVDKGGNYKAELLTESLLGDATYVTPFISTISETTGGIAAEKISFAPKKKTPRAAGALPDPVDFSIGSTGSAITPTSFKVAIHHGIPAKVEVKLLKEFPAGQWTQTADFLVAGECYTVSPTVTDANDQAIDTLDGIAITEIGAKNFSVSDTLRNFSGGFYTRDSSPPHLYRQAILNRSQGSFVNGSEFDGKIPNFVETSFTLVSNGGSTQFTVQPNTGKMTTRDGIFFCQSDAANGSTRLLEPQIVLELFTGLSFKTKSDVLTLVPKITGSSQKFAVQKGPPAAIALYAKTIAADGTEQLGPPVCGYNRDSEHRITLTALGSVPAAKRFQEIWMFGDSTESCVALNADQGGLNVIAKLTDAAGNILPQTANGTWAFKGFAGGNNTGMSAATFQATSDTFRDTLRRAGVFTIEFTDTVTQLKLNHVVQVKAGRANRFELAAPVSVATTEAFQARMNFFDNHSNHICAGFAINGVSYGFETDLLFGTADNTANFKYEWISSPLPTVAQFPVTGAGLLGANGTDLEATYSCAGGLTANTNLLQIPKAGSYTLRAESSSLLTAAGAAIPAATSRKSAKISVVPGAVEETRTEFVPAVNGNFKIPTAAATELSDAATSAGTFPRRLVSYNMTHDLFGAPSGSGTAVAIYLAGYDREGNFSSLVPSSVGFVSGSELENLSSSNPDFTNTPCSPSATLSRSICNLSAHYDLPDKDKMHIIGGIRAGTATLRITPAGAGETPIILPELTIVAGTPRILRPTQVNRTNQLKNDAGETRVGSKFTFKLRLTDSNYNTILDQDSALGIEFRYRLLDSFAFAADETIEGFPNVKPADGGRSFNDGITTDTFTAELFVAGNYYMYFYTGSTDGYFTLGKDHLVQPDPFHHYGTITARVVNVNGQVLAEEYFPHRDLPPERTFSALIQKRDQFGNLTTDTANLPVNLSIVRSNGASVGSCSLAGAATTNISMPSGAALIDGLRYPQSGAFKLIASDANGKTTPLSAARTIQMVPSFDTLKDFEVRRLAGGAPDITVNAGSAVSLAVSSRDACNQPLIGFDEQLSSLSYGWSGASNALNTANTPPSLPAVLAFTAGQSTATSVFFRAENIAANTLTVSAVGGGTAFTGRYAGAIGVSPGPVFEYVMKTCIAGGTCDQTAKTRTADSTSNGRFNISISAFDEWKNQRAGEAGLRIAVNKLSGVGDLTSDILSATGENTDTSRETTSINMSQSASTLSLTDLYYPVGHNVEFTLANSAIDVFVKPRINFSYTADSIHKYKLNFSQNIITAGPNNVTVTASALDRAENIIPTLDSILNLRAFTLDGPLFSPNGNPPTLSNGTSALTASPWSFSSGVASQTLSLYRAQIFQEGGFILTDNAGVVGKNGALVRVDEAAAQEIRIPAGGGALPNQTAGSSFNIESLTLDAFGNPTDVGCAAGLTIGNGLSSPGGHGGTATNALVPAAVKLQKGSYRFSGIQLFKAGSTSLTFNACGSARPNLSFFVHTAPVNRMVISSTNSLPADEDLGLTGAGDTAELTCGNPTIGSSATGCGSVYSFFWDTFGNRIDATNNSCQWSWSNSSSSGAGKHNMTIPTPPNLDGLGGSRSVSSNDFIDGVLTCSRDSKSKSIRFWGGLAKLDATAAFSKNGTTINTLNVPSGTQLSVSQIRLWASRDGQLVALPPAETNATKKLEFSSTLVVADLPSAVNCALNNSQCPTTFTGFLRTAGTAGVISLNVNGKSVTFSDVTVDPGIATQIDVAQVPSSASAGVPLTDTKVTVRDEFGNPTNTFLSGGSEAQCGALAVTFGADQISSGRNGGTVSSPVANPSSPLVNVTQRGVYLSTLTLFKSGLNTVTFSGCGVAATKPVTVTPNAARVGFLSTAANDSSVSASTAAFDCPNSNDSPNTSAVSCSSIQAYFWDDFGNSLNGSGSPVDCAWNYVNATPAAGLTAAVEPSKTPTAGSMAITATDFIDGTLSCTKDGKVATSKVHGGVSKFTIGSTVPASINNTVLVADSNNVTLSSLQLFQRREGSDVAKTTAANSTFKINIDTGSSTNAFADIVASGESGRDTTNKLITRTFGTSGAATSSVALNYKKAPAGNSNSLTLKIQGKSIPFSNITVEPNNASKYLLPTVTQKTAGTTFGFNVEVQDQFDNRTSKSTSGTSCATGALSLSGSGTSAGSSATSKGVATAPNFAAATGTSQMSATAGVYSVGNVTLYRAGTESLTVQACGLAAQNFSVPVVHATVTAGALRTASAVSSADENELICPMHASENRLDCSGKAVFAYFWDAFGNTATSTAAQCESWAFDHLTRPDAVTLSTTGAAATVNLSNKGTEKFVDGRITCNKSALGTPLTLTLWGGVKSVAITAQNSANADITNAAPAQLTAATGNLRVSTINLRTTKGGADIASPISLIRQVTWSTTATNNGFGSGGAGATTKLGQAENINANFTSGGHSAPYSFNFIKPEANKVLRANVFGLNSNDVQFSVQSAAAHSIVLTAVNSAAATVFPALTAGTSFNFDAEVRDQFSNRTTLSASSNDCSATNLTIDLPAGQTKASPGAPGTTSTFPTGGISVASPTNNGAYPSGSVTLFNSTNTQINLSACGVNAQFAVTVSPAIAAHVRVNTSSTSNATALAEHECDNTGTGETVRCANLHAHFWDSFGNVRTGDTCNTWQYTPESGTDSPVFSAGAVASQTNLTHASAKFFDGVLRCDKAGLSATDVRLWGGVKTVTLTHNLTGANITAGLGNIEISSAVVQTPKAGVLTPPTLNLSNKPIRISSSASNALVQSNADVTPTADTTLTATGIVKNCNFAANGNGVRCNPTTPLRFNFITAEASKELTLSVHGVSATQLAFSVGGAAASTLAVTAVPTTVVAGDAFGLNLSVRDAFNNPTSTGCGAVTITGPTTSLGAGPAGALATAFDLTTAAGQAGPSALGTYTLTNLKLFNASIQTLNISACGLNATTSPAVQVRPASPRFSTLRTTNTRANTSEAEVICGNAATSPFAVSCPATVAFAFFWDEFGNEITAANNSNTNDVNCNSWSFAAASGAPTTFTFAAANTASTGISHTGDPRFVDGTLTCNKTGVTAPPSMVIWGGVKTVSMTATDSAGVNITGSNPTLTAGTGNIKVTGISLSTTKAGTTIASPLNGNAHVQWVSTSTGTGSWGTGGSVATTQFGQNEVNTLSFAAGVHTPSPVLSFNKVKAELNRNLSVKVFGVSSNLVPFSVQPASAAAIAVAATPTTVTAGSQVTVTVSSKDSFDNPSFSGCSTAALSAESSLNAPNGAAPDFSATTLTQSGTVGTFDTATVALKKAGAAQRISATACGLPAVNSPEITVNAAALNNIVLSTSNTPPAFGAELSSGTDLPCTAGSTVNCPAVHAFGRDTFGNNNGAVTCATWDFVPDAPAGAPALTQTTNSTSTTVSNSTTHVDGTLTCTFSGFSKSVPMFGQINKTPELACAAWSCNAGAAESTCTLSNNTGYEISAVALSPNSTVANTCTGSLASGSNCTFTYQGTSPNTFGNTTVTSTPSAPTLVNLQNVSAAVGGGVAAPNCSQSLTAVQSAWTCAATNTPTKTITFTNPNGLNAFQILSGDPSLTTANGATTTTTCGTSLAAGATCTVTITGTAATSGQTVSLQLRPDTGSYFNQISVTTDETAPSCP